MAEALYRKYRPQVFEDVVGQEHIERTIKNAIDQDKVSHAYLFTGPRGTGKTTTARLLAKALLCEKGPTPEPDGTCANCESIAKGSHPDVYELDAASRTGVENVREEIIGRVQFAPTQGRYKIYIIDEVHMLSTAAFNALLKTLEEPPTHVVFVLCTTESQKVPETIHSRCQRFDFRRISVESIISRLGAICVAEGVEFEGEALDLIAHRAEGGMRNALTSLEQLIIFGEGKVRFKDAENLLGSLDSSDMAEIVAAIGKRDIAACFTWTANYVETGSDLAQFVHDLAEHTRNMYVLTFSNSDTALEVNEVTRRELTEELEYFGQDRLSRMLAVLGDLSAELRTSINPRLSFEIALTRLVRPDSDMTLESLAERIEALESGYSSSAHVFSASVPATEAPSVTTSASTPAAAAPSAVRRPAATAASMQQNVEQPSPALAATRQNSSQTSAAEIDQSTTRANEGQAVAASAAENSQAVASNLENPAVLQRMWQAALQVVKKDKAAYGVLFLNTKTHYDTLTQELVIEFPVENVFAYTAVQKPEVFAVVSKALSQAVGGTLAFRYAKASSDAKAQTAFKPRAQAELKPTRARAQTGAQAAARPADQAVNKLGAWETASLVLAAPDPEPTPLDVYEADAASQTETSAFAATASSQTGTVSVAAPSEDSSSGGTAASVPSNDLGESALKAMLTQEYGEGIVFDVVDE